MIKLFSPAHLTELFRETDVKLREVDALVRAKEKRAAANVVPPVLPAWSTKLRPSMAAMIDAVNQARLARPPRHHRPDGAAGGDEERIAALEALVFEMEVEGEDIEHELRELVMEMAWWEKMAMAAVEAGDDALARAALALRRQQQNSRAALIREVKLSRRICAEYRIFLDELRRRR